MFVEDGTRALRELDLERRHTVLIHIDDLRLDFCDFPKCKLLARGD
jgi:hypothetical protein